MEENEKNQVYYAAYTQIFTYLKQIHYPDEISPKIMEQVQSFKIFEQFIDTNHDKKSYMKGVSIGYGLS